MWMCISWKGNGSYVLLEMCCVSRYIRMHVACVVFTYAQT